MKISNEKSISLSELDEYNRLKAEIEKLNEKYEDILEPGKGIIKVARKDFGRISTKRVNQIKIDIEALKNGSEKILYTIDKKGKVHDNYHQMNLFQKLASNVSTRVRKMAACQKAYHHKSLKAIIGLGLVAGIGALAKNADTLSGFIGKKSNNTGNSGNSSNSGGSSGKKT